MSNLLSKWLTYDRATYSGNAVAHGIKNTPNDRELKNLISWGEHIYDPVCEHFGRVFLSSVFRDKDIVKDKWGKAVSVNGLAGGSPTSGHPNGECGDLDGDAPNSNFVAVDNNALFHWIRKNLKYDQLIAEYEANGKPRWVHVGYRAVGNRQQTLIATKNSANSTVYMVYSDGLYKKVYKGSRDIGEVIDLDGFEMPLLDYQTSLDETCDEGYGQEVLLGREFTEDSAATPHISEPIVSTDQGIVTVRIMVEETEFVIKIEIESQQPIQAQ